MRNLSVQRVSRDGTPQYVLKASVGPGSRSRVLVVGYFVDSLGYSVRSQSYGYSNPDGALCVGTWVSAGSSESSYSVQTYGYSPTPTMQVEMVVPAGVAQPTPSIVQFVLFDENNAELARGTVAVPAAPSPIYPNYSKPGGR